MGRMKVERGRRMREWMKERKGEEGGRKGDAEGEKGEGVKEEREKEKE